MAERLVRSLVVWFQDWPVTALVREKGIDSSAPIAVLESNLVVACSPAARAEGVRRGQRRRDAQARCPSLHIDTADPLRDGRAFAPALDRIEELVPGTQLVRPGLCALRVRGPARYYGGEAEAAHVLLSALADLGFSDVRAGVADGPFTAEQAAKIGDPVRIVPAGSAAEFLAPLPIAAIGDVELIGLLTRLGVRTLGDFAALGAERVSERFGPRGTLLHSLADGRDSRAVIPTPPPPHLDREVTFEPPLELVDQVAFGVRMAAEEFIAGLGEAGLVCTELRIEVTGERGDCAQRVWLHPGSFDAAAVVDRVRWQLEASMGSQESHSAVALVKLSPEAVDAVAGHRQGLFGQGPDERVHHALSRVQAMLGHRGVLVPVVSGGRSLIERQSLVPWGDRATNSRERARPWPGSLPHPLPSTVFSPPGAVAVRAADGSTVTVDERARLSAPPAMIENGGTRRSTIHWAGPWPIWERAWDDSRHRRAYRFQVIDTDMAAWLLVFEEDRWWAEARYD